MLKIGIVLLLWTCAIFFCLWIGEKMTAKRERIKRANLQERFDEYMQKHEHCMTCDLCDIRNGCEKYAGRGRAYIACPFFEHKEGWGEET